MKDKIKIKNAPDKIYLNLGDDFGIEKDPDFGAFSEVTWCQDKINKNDIEYRIVNKKNIMDTKYQIIDKLKKIINLLKKRIDEQFDPLFWTKLQKMESELAALESQPSEHETEEYGNPSTTDFALNQSIKISDEEIEKEGRKHYNSFKGDAFSVRLIAWCTGAKWLNDKLSSK